MADRVIIWRIELKALSLESDPRTICDLC